MAACTTPVERFEIRAVDTYLQPLRCLVVVDNRWPRSPQDVVYTDASVEVNFADTDQVMVRVQAVTPDIPSDRVPNEADRAPYRVELRELRRGDPRVQLFVLEAETR